MKEFISKVVEKSKEEVKLDLFTNWLENFDFKMIGSQQLDQLIGLAEIAEDRSKIALIDLLRLIVLEEGQAEYLLGKHWELIDVCIIGYVECQDLKDTSPDAKIMHNYHLACLKFLTNFYQTKIGRQIMQTEERS